MPEADITREQLLATVHELKRGDLLVVRIPDHTTTQAIDAIVRRLNEVLDPLGIPHLIMAGSITVEVVRREGAAE